MLFLTARRWAGYFFALCGIASIKAILALAFGVTVSVPRLVTDRQLVFELLCLLVGLSILTFRFVTTVPESNSAISSPSRRGDRARMGHFSRTKRVATDRLRCCTCRTVGPSLNRENASPLIILQVI
jgi:hypothetical protein